MNTPGESANLDFLRAYAVLSVYVGHLLQTLHTKTLFAGVTIYGIAQTGVLLFFVHTSLVLMPSLERIQAAGSRLFRAFYIRRAFRIYPLSIVTVTLVFAAHVPVFPTMPYVWKGWGTLFANLGLVQNLTRNPSVPEVLWSLPFEVQMYLVLPVLFLLLHRFRSAWFPIILWIVDVAAILLMQAWNVKVVPGLLLYSPCFLGGIIGYRLWREPRRGWPFWGWPIAIVACTGLRVLAEATGSRETMTHSAWLACLLLGLAAPQFLELRLRWLRVLARTVATYSYGIYLSHCIVFWVAFVQMKNEPLWVQAVTCAALSVAGPLAMYHGIEKPMIDAGVVVSRRHSGARAADA
jgi:peptidoglycan/LPS O-acetylase OafA/YrhL